MSANGAVWGRVRSRLRAFPEHLAACGPEAAAYGRCVQASTAPGGRLNKDLCAREFEALRSCFAAAMLCPQSCENGQVPHTGKELQRCVCISL
ncbi:NADH dehydrogenase [ubiquinone] 1 alpha subcomplex assembly factor 8 isoform X2 [Eulemur rufifrons]|uniref:NADH dehydrogenase [ubiquinone] 1 alpha subcomplex assembly factor 8 isoform X2 n=1 Tax=Eulemur rufifrons TaxID=859984 RepID=UPI0037441694